MPNIGNDMDNVGQQAMNDVTDKAKSLGQKGMKKAGRMAKKATRKATNALRKGVVKGVKAAAKFAVNIAKIFIKIIVQLISLAGGPMLVCLGIFLVGSLIWNFLAEERGSNQSDNLDPSVQNPAIVDTETGITTALAMTEPQAVIDAYYKYMSTCSFTKSYNDKLYTFNKPEQTQDFAGLRDYFDRENSFYLSDDFIRMTDELLHDNSFYFPEQIIKPVFGKKVKLEDKDGNESTVYTSRLPIDFKTGAKSKMFDEEIVKDFDKIMKDASQLDSDIGSDETQNLIAKSQTPTPSTDADGVTTYKLTDRNVIAENSSAAVQPGLWDYGFGSVLQYQPEQKISYIECTYTHVGIDIDRRHWIDGEPEGHWGDWEHAWVINWSLEGITTVAELDTKLGEYVAGYSSSTVDYRYQKPTNIAAIIDDTKAWGMGSEPNKTEETKFTNAYNRKVTNQHIDMKVTDAKDVDIDRMQFQDADLKKVYGNKGSGLYPINIAVISHAATFSGNIHYTISPADGDDCEKTVIPLSENSVANIDHREPVTKISVAGGCSKSNLTATRTGNVITQMPKIEEDTSPWGFEYIQEYADEYTNYVPSDYMEDLDFFLRTGLKAAEGTSEKTEYLNNLAFLMDLGLLRIYNGNVSLNAVGVVDAADMGDSTSDLYILSHLIAVEAGPNKLDKLMVGSVFVNRVYSSRFPNTFWEVLTQPNQYSTYPNRYDQPGWEPTEADISSAMQVLSGQFTIPENIVGQSAKIQGTIYKVVDNGAGFYTHYYCTGNNEAVSTVDRYGRPAPSADQLEALAAALDGVTPSEISGSAATFDLSTSAFIGDSLVVGLDTNNNLQSGGATVIAESGAGLQKIKTLVENETIPSTVKTVYLLAGTYSCTDYDATFESQYQAILTTIGEKAPGAKIVLTSLPPCIDGKGHSASNAYIMAKNQVINKIASASGMQILDIWSLLQKNNSLDPAYSADGLNLNSSGYNVWFLQVKGGATTGSINIPDASLEFDNLDQNGMPIDSDYKLYDISSFDTLTAISMQAHISQADSMAKNWLSRLIDNVAEDVLGFLTQFWDTISNTVFPTKNTTLDKCFQMGAQYNSGDVRGVVYHSITFATQVWYSTAEDAAEEQLQNGDITFLFVGKDAMLGLGTLGYGGMRTVPGTGTTLPGIISPTNTYYSPLSGFNGSYMELNVPAGTNVLAVGDGKITAVNNDSSKAQGKYVTQEIEINGLGGGTLTVTYGYLNTINVSVGSVISKGDLIGTSGKKPGDTAALYLQTIREGSPVDPMSIFYQSMTIYGGGSLGGDLYNSDGTVNEAKIDDLEKQLTSIIGVSKTGDISGYNKSQTSSPYHKAPINSLQGLQCTWWAWGRGYEYLCTIQNTTITKTQYAAIIGNGGEFYKKNKAAGLFNYGSTPKPNSLVCYRDPGGVGHVAYVEAVDYTNSVYYESECGAGVRWMGVNKRAFGYAPHWHGRQYTLEGFVYLDEPKV